MKEQNHVDNTITTIEMCAGYGGIGLGIKRIFGERLRTIAYCELEGFAQANLISKMEAGLLDAAPLWSDLKTFPYAEFHGLVDILIAGYPCQPFSAAGKRAGKDDPRHLWPWIADGIRLLRPRMCFFENVEGHISLGLSTVISDLEELGYKVSWGIFSASEVGAPHQRKRIFILAYDQSLGIQGRWPSWIEESRPHAGQALPVRGGDAGGELWPSRPGEQQFAWEPPRVVGAGLAHTGSLGRGGRRDGDEGGLRGEIQTAGSCGGGGEAGLAHTHGCRGEESKHQQANLPSEPSGGNAEAMGNASEREDHGREPGDLGQAAREGRCGDDAADCTSEVLGNPSSERCEQTERALRGKQQSSGTGEECGLGAAEAMGNAESWRRGESGDETCKGQGHWPSRSGRGDDEQRKTERTMGLHSHGTSYGLGHAELSSLCDSELAEIREWMVKCDNRTDELRLLGNGVVPATAERAFRTLMEELQK